MQCLSVKNKKALTQRCPHSSYPNSLFCGIHKRTKKIILYEFLDDSEIGPKKKKKKTAPNLVKIIDEIVTYEKNDKKYYEADEIINCISLSKLKIPILRKTVDHYNTRQLVPIHMVSKRGFYNSLLEYFTKVQIYEQNVDKIIKVQSFIRRYLVITRIEKRINCVNNDDLCTMENKFNIPESNYFSYIDNGFEYCFDIRTFNKILESNEKPINPYTMNPISGSVISDFKKKKNIFLGKNIAIEFEKPKLSPEKQLEQKAIAIFHKFDELDNYTNHKWFMDLSLDELKKLYVISEDIWNYRAELSIEQKIRIVKFGKAFFYPVPSIKYNNNMTKIRHIILNEFNRFVTEGINNSEKKLGAMLMLTALVEVSGDAANAMPHLVQIHN